MSQEAGLFKLISVHIIFGVQCHECLSLDTNDRKILMDIGNENNQVK
jgi:hypothetical protein